MDRQELQSKKEEYQKDLERLRDAQRKLERDKEAVQQQLDKMEQLPLAEVSGDTSKIITIIMMLICCSLQENCLFFCPLGYRGTLAELRGIQCFTHETPPRLLFTDAYTGGLHPGSLDSEFKSNQRHSLNWQTCNLNSRVIITSF